MVPRYNVNKYRLKKTVNIILPVYSPRLWFQMLFRGHYYCDVTSFKHIKHYAGVMMNGVAHL